MRHDRDFACDYGVLEQVSPLIRRIVARNPGPFTFFGTGTYVVGRGQVAVIDPGPDLAEHVEALLAALTGESVSHILITHTHADHSPAAARLQAATGAPTYAFGQHPSGVGVEAGGDLGFRPDRLLADGDVVEGPGWDLQALHTPGHISNHLCFALPQERALFSGDQVMGWSTTVIMPPDGNMSDYMRSLRHLRRRDEALYWPTHGGPIREPAAYVGELIAHREGRRAAIQAALANGPATPPDLVARIYRDLGPRLLEAAALSVLAHLLELEETGLAKRDGTVWYPA